jgi:hypothetical protein
LTLPGAADTLRFAPSGRKVGRRDRTKSWTRMTVATPDDGTGIAGPEGQRGREVT